VHTFMVCMRSGAFNMLDKPIRFINMSSRACPPSSSATCCWAYEPQIGRDAGQASLQECNPTYTILDLSWLPRRTPKAEGCGGFPSRRPRRVTACRLTRAVHRWWGRPRLLEGRC
jgi:hypothetical protein